MSWEVGDYDGLWVPGMLFPQPLLDHIKAGGYFEAHGTQFETAMWINILTPQEGIPFPVKWRDTLAVCAYRSLPLGLDAVGDVLDLDIKKDKRGKYLIQKLCKPRKVTIKNKDKWNEMERRLGTDGGVV
jgi:DNA polymerase